MVRETRHLWVGNLPDNIREDRIREHFKRYGRVQNVKLLGRTESPCTSTTTGAPASLSTTGGCATVAFMDIKSASKAHNVEHVLDEKTLTTEYYEPAAIPSAAGAPSAGSSPAGSGYSGSSSSVNSAPTPASTSRYHLSSEENVTGTCPLAASAAAPAAWRGTNDSATDFCRRGSTPAAYSRYPRNTNAPYSTPPNNTDRTPHHRWYAGGSESAPSTPGGAAESGPRRRRSGSGSHSSSCSSDQDSSDSRASTPAAPPPNATPVAQWSATACGRPLAICVRNLPTRSTDSSLKDGLYHEYKKHGKVMWVQVVGQNADRYAVVRFKKPSDVEKAIEVSQDKQFFGCKITVMPHQSCDEDAESAKPFETDIDEYHPKATRTLFIGNLEKDVTQQQLREKFKRFGRIIEIDIKKGGGGPGPGYAFCQFASISSVVDAIKAMDGENIGSSRVKLGFGKPVATTCVWIDGLTEANEKQVLGAVSRCGTAKSVCVDRASGAALVHFEQAAAASNAVRDLRRYAASADSDQRRLMVDYASRECQETFYEHLEKQGSTAAPPPIGTNLTSRYMPPSKLDMMRYAHETSGRGRTQNYGRNRPMRYPETVEYQDRRFRSFEDIEGGSPVEEPPYEERLQSVVMSPCRQRKHRRDSTPEDLKHPKERHRSNGTRRCSGDMRHRSRSGSRSEHRRRSGHRRRREESGSRAGTPLCDELPDGPAEPRRPPQPRDRSHLPMSLPLPKFAAELLRAAHPHGPPPLPAPAPASPSRPPSASSSSGGSAPHSPSLEERIRSLDEKYEKWSGSRSSASEAAERGRFRHRLLEVDINEVRPSDVVKSLLAKRSVFDEDSERLEGASSQRPPSPEGSPLPSVASRALQYSFPPHSSSSIATSSEGSSDVERVPPNGIATRSVRDHETDCVNSDTKILDNLDNRTVTRTNSALDSVCVVNDSRRTDKLLNSETLSKSSESDSSVELGLHIKPSSIDKQPDIERKFQDRKDHQDHNQEVRRRIESMERDNKSKNDEGNKVPKNSSVENDKFLNHTQDNHETTQSILKDLQNKTNEKHDNSKKCTESESGRKFLFDRTKLGDPEIPLNLFEESTLKSDIFQDTEFKQQVSIKIDKTEKNNQVVIHRKSCHELEKSENKAIEEKKEIFENNRKNSIPHPCVDTVNQNSDPVNIHEKSVPNKPQREENDPDKPHKIIKNDNKKHSKSNYLEEQTLFGKLLTLNEKKPKSDKVDFDRLKTNKEKNDKEKHESPKLEKSRKHDKDKSEKEKKNKDDLERKHSEKSDRNKKESDKEDIERKHVDKADRSKKDFCNPDKDCSKYDSDRVSKEDKKHSDTKSHDHKKDRERKKDDNESHKYSKKEDKHKHDRHKKEYSESKRDSKRDHDTKSKKVTKDESNRDLCRKDSTDSSTSRTSHDSLKNKESDTHETKDDIKSKILKHNEQHFHKHKSEKEISKVLELSKPEESQKAKSDLKDDKDLFSTKTKHESSETKPKLEASDKPRHYSVDSPNLESKRKDRLNSCSSLPSNIGHKRRMSSHDSVESLINDNKKIKQDIKLCERKESKDSKHKISKFSKGHFAKLIESKTKEDKKNQVKPPDDAHRNEWQDGESKDFKLNEKCKTIKKSSKDFSDEKSFTSPESSKSDGLQSHLDFLATLELRSSEEDEKQKAFRNEMKEKKRIQQLQQIQELQKQKDAFNNTEVLNRKDDKKIKSEDKKKDISREKRMSTDRKSRDEKPDNRRKSRKQIHSSDTSDTDEPKKHSIFDIVDDGPTYISMYDKVKARSCKNMQKQEEEKRQEKIKAKFSQLKQSRAKREEKKRSSWDEDSDSEYDRKKSLSKHNSRSSDEEHVNHSSKGGNSNRSLHYNDVKNEDYDDTSNNEEDSKNKLCRKNSRSRILSDTSDDENDNMNSLNIVKSDVTCRKQRARDFFTKHIKENMETEYLTHGKLNSSMCDIKSDNENREIKRDPSSDRDEYKSTYSKTNMLDSSENESSSYNRYVEESRRKHKKKQKKERPSLSGDELKSELSNSLIEMKHRHNTDKTRKHSNKKEKRKDKIRNSIDIEDMKEEKTKNKKVHLNDNRLIRVENHIKKDGKMEDIFGPLSDESDTYYENEYSTHNYSTNLHHSKEHFDINGDTAKLKEKEDIKRKKDKKRKEKRHNSMFKEDDNSLDVDAVGKAIEERLCADSVSDENVINARIYEYRMKNDDDKYFDNATDMIFANKHSDRHKKDKEKRKKKKRNKDERQRHHHSHHHDKVDKLELPMPDLLQNTNLHKIHSPIDRDDISTSTDTHSLPRLTESPPPPHKYVEIMNEVCISSSSLKDNDMILEINDDKIDHNINDVIAVDAPSVIVDVDSDKSSSSPSTSEHSKFANCSSVIEHTLSDNAVRSISSSQEDKYVETPISIVEEKAEEKPRAIISQEETADAVAALLGESFGGSGNSFDSYTEPSEQTQENLGTASIGTENIPEEDAEEMRQAVQNLNASEMELKPDTPMSDNDLLLIDTDNEECEEPATVVADKAPINIISTGNASISNAKRENVITKPKPITSSPNVTNDADENKGDYSGNKILISGKENSQQITSTATPVITSWTTTNKLRECQANVMMELSKDNEIKSPKHTTDIEHIMTSHTIVVNKNHQRPRVEDLTNTTTIRTSTSYALVNQISRSTQVTNMQPPTIKIPESNIHQKQQGIMISPRIASEVRLQSPKTSPQADGITSPRLTILSTSQQTAGLPSPTNLQQRSPGQVTLMRMQQPPLSPIQNMHLSHTTRTMVSPNRPNSVLVQTQAPGHFNRLPGLTPLTKQVNTGNVLSHNKTGISNPTIIQQVISNDTRKTEHRDNNESSKIISPTRLQQSNNPTVMAQNRLLARQNAIHLANINTGIHLSNKVLINHVSDKRENVNFKTETQKSDPSCFGHASTIQVNHSAASIIQGHTKHEQYANRHNLPNVIQSLNSQRLLTTVPMTNVIQIDSNRNQAILSTIRHPTVLTKVDSPKNVAVTTSSMTSTVTTPLTLKSSSTNAVRSTDNNDIKSLNLKVVTDLENRFDGCKPTMVFDATDRRKELYIKPYTPISKCETDFEELLKDNTNEIKVTNNPDKGLEIHVGKSISNFMNENQKEIAEGDKSLRSEEKISLSTDLGVSENVGMKFEETEIKEESNTSLQLETLVLEENKESVKIEETQSENIDADVQPKNPENAVNSSEHIIEEKIKSLTNIVNENRKSEESDTWSAKDVNIESVIKKVDSLCNDMTVENNEEITNSSETKSEDMGNNDENSEIMSNNESQEEDNVNVFDENSPEKSNVSKRGGRAFRGRKADKNLDRVQTRHISKAARRGTASRRGRGRGRVEKKMRNTANVCPNNLPGDVYDFHEDSGDESASQNKSERPRLILTIKSPVMINANATPTSTLSIASPFINREEKAEDFLSPSSNTRKSRRLQEKDVHRSTNDDLEDTVKPSKPGKDSNKKRPTRQVTKTTYQDKSPVGTDVRKSPRGVKRTKNRSLSDASIDSSDEKTMKKEETPRDAKIAKLSEVTQPELPKDDVEPIEPPAPKPVVVNATPIVIPIPAPAVIPDPTLTVTPNPSPAVIPSHKPIMKPPKKMISEISAKLGTAIFESTASPPMMRSTISPSIPEKAADDPFNRPLDLDKQRFRDYREGRNIECANIGSEEIPPAATAESHTSDMAFPRRIVDNVPVNMMPVGATEATDARVQSPALPHRPPSAHLATPVLIRGSEGGACAPRDALLYRIPYGGTASLPRGAHHPPPLPPHLKQVAIVGPHHQHPHQGSTARVTITSVPSGSPQGQVGSSCDSSDLARIPPPAHQQTSPITPGDGMYHFSHQHYQMYQQHFRATQHESRNTTSPFTRMEAEGSEAPMPPLELRRPPGARVPRPAHSPSLAERFLHCRSPPPAHAGVGVPRLPSALPPPAAPGPPHASQVPREADSLQTLLRRYPVMWQGLLALKNDNAAVQMHFVHGNAAVAANTLPRHMDGSTPPLRITQRMRLEPSQLDQVTRKMQLENEHCMLLALPCGRDHMDVLQQSTNLTAGFITYLRRKQAAGIFNVGPPGQSMPTFTVHIFPSCDFANENLNRIAPDLMHRVTDIAHLLIVIATV